MSEQKIDNTQKHLVLIDGMSFLFRAFHAIRSTMTREDGLPTNALYGFSQMLVRVVDDLKPTHCAMVLDSPGKTFRSAIYPAYKAHRPPPPPELIAQLDYLEPLVKAFGLPILRESGVEADDLIATAVTHARRDLQGARVTIVTSDKDLMQLVGDENGTLVRLLDTLKDRYVSRPEVHEKFGVTPAQVVSVQALMGDASDNVPGVPGIGPKTASLLINEFSDLHTLLANTAKIKNERIRGLLDTHREQALISEQLVTLKTDVPLPPDHNLAFHPALHRAADYLRDTLEFRSLAKRLEARTSRPPLHPTSERGDGEGSASPAHPASPQDETAGARRAVSSRFVRPTLDNEFSLSPPAAKTLKEAAWGTLEPASLANSPYECVTTPSRWAYWLDQIAHNGWVAFDTETTGLNPREATLVGLSFATAPGVACYVPLHHIDPPHLPPSERGAGDGSASPSRPATAGRPQAQGGLSLLPLFSSQDSPAPTLPPPPQLPAAAVLNDLRALLQNPAIKKVAHNLKFDWQVAAHALGPIVGLAPDESGAPLQTLFTNYDDTLLQSASLDGGRWAHSLNDLALRHLQHEMIPYDAVTGKGKAQKNFAAVALPQATAYAAEDADATARLYLYFTERLKNEGTSLTDLPLLPPSVRGAGEGSTPALHSSNGSIFDAPQGRAEPAFPRGPATIYDLELKLLPVIVALETRGITLNLQLLKEISSDLAQRIATLETDVWTLAGNSDEKFNLNSPKQLGEVLFDKLHLGTPAQQKKRSTGVDVLEAIFEDSTPKNPGDERSAGGRLVEKMLEYRQITKLRGTYTEALPEAISPITHRVHTTYNQMGAATGRFSSTDPNLQNIPIRTAEGRKIRQAFIPPKPGWSLLSADYSQIELRLLAHFSGSPGLRAAFNEGLDIHAYTASLVANKNLADVTKEERRAAKFVNFGLVYGMGARALAGQIGCSLPEAQHWLTAYFQRYEGVREYLESTRKFAKENGYVETLFGRRVWLPDIASGHGGLRSNAERAAINAPLQGSNADIIKHAMPRVEAFLQQQKMQAQTLLQVHDELVLEAPAAELSMLQQHLPAIMTQSITLAVPLLVETGVGPNWDAAH